MIDRRACLLFAFFSSVAILNLCGCAALKGKADTAQDSFGEAKGIVGVILPLSGKYKEFGESMLHGLECAIGTKEPCVGPKGIKLNVKDAGEKQEDNIRAVEELVQEGAQAIIGPMLSAAAEPAAKRAQELGVPLISLSQKDNIAQIGDYIFRNSASTSKEVDALADYAVSMKSFKKFFIFYPSSKKGLEYKQLFANAVAAKGGTISGVKAYSSRDLGFLAAVQKAKESGKTAEDVQQQIVEQRGGRVEGIIKGAAADGEEGFELLDLPSGGKGYDAVFVPDDADTVGFIASQMALAKNPKVTFLGTSRLDDSKLVERGKSYVEGTIFVEAFYKDSPDSGVQQFVSQFTKAYDAAPTFLEALGFDSMRAVSAALSGGWRSKSKSAVKDALMKLKNFPGVSGFESFDADGDAERKFQVLTVDAGNIRLAK